jgi:hypothetical protein
MRVAGMHGWDVSGPKIILLRGGLFRAVHEIAARGETLHQTTIWWTGRAHRGVQACATPAVIALARQLLATH